MFLTCFPCVRVAVLRARLHLAGKPNTVRRSSSCVERCSMPVGMIAAAAPDKIAYVMADTGSGGHVRRTRSDVEPRCTTVPQVGPQCRRSHCTDARESSALPANLLGGAACRLVLHRDQLATAAARGRVHRQQLRGACIHHVERVSRGCTRAERPNSEGRKVLHDRRGDSRLRVMGSRDCVDAEGADRRPDRRAVDVVLLRNHRISEGHQAGRCRVSRSEKPTRCR